KELIHDTVQPSIDAINTKIDTLVETIEASHLKPQRSFQMERVASDYQTEPTYHDKPPSDERKVVVINYVGCCRPYWRPHWHHCCRHSDYCCRPHWNHCCRPHWNHYCKPRGDDP